MMQEQDPSNWVLPHVQDVARYGYPTTIPVEEDLFLKQMNATGQWVEMVVDPVMGRTVRALRDIPRGALVLNEPPLLRIKPIQDIDPRLRQVYEQACSELGCSLPPLLDLHAYTSAPAPVRRALLTSCCTFTLPNRLEDEETEDEGEAMPGILRVARKVARWWVEHQEQWEEGVEQTQQDIAEYYQSRYEQSHQNVPESSSSRTSATGAMEGSGCWEAGVGRIGRRVREQELIQAQGVIALNAHNLGELPGSAVYLVGSKLSHACVRPSCVYHFQPGQAVGHHRAVMDIPKGEILTSDYMGFLSVCSSSLRVDYLLATKLFRCLCPLCDPLVGAADIPRALPCPACVPREEEGLLSSQDLTTPGNGHWAQHPVITRTARVEDQCTAGDCSSGKIKEDEGRSRGRFGEWMCDTCSAVFTDEQVNVEVTHNGDVSPLFDWERKTELMVHGWMQLNPTLDPQEGHLHPRLRGLLHFIDSFTQVLGCQHWTVMVLRSMQLEQWLWLCKRVGGKRLKAALEDRGYLLSSQGAFLAEVWDAVKVLWQWQQRCGHSVGVWATVGDLMGARQIQRIVGEDTSLFLEILSNTKRGAFAEYGYDSEEVDKLESAFADLNDEWPTLGLDSIMSTPQTIVMLTVDHIASDGVYVRVEFKVDGYSL